MTTVRINNRHYAYGEGYAAANEMGYSGTNPYRRENPAAHEAEAAFWWREGFVSAVKERLDAGLPAIAEKETAE